ncbi:MULTISPECIES: hypothetical protein [Planktothrix]|jgi:hypothetical protein|uniref:Uncharacterized protein n=1 Tax=Planktothrix rubescens CCAP 1459/22 TaxID=329571 RepID=A0A6J7ZJF6_PLARU|nr:MULTISPECIES: hypothetical protein [Planktothrix]CAC5341951.1 hypothetical protein PLAN_150062 [Planktothrix rubescens NIVA-CYA 18]CAD5927690.1 hypothetical protein PCC7821_01070 [Planktothrix rubescens NIVA-CYA 18]
MNNPLDNGSQYDLDSIFNQLIQSLDIDPQQHPIPEQTHHNIMSVPDFNSYDPHHPHFDISNSGWNGEQDQGLQSSPLPNFDYPTPEFNPGQTDLEQFNPYQLPEQTDYSTGYQTDHHFGGMGDHSQQMSTFSAMHSSDPVEKGDSNSVTIYSNGDVYWDRSGGQAGHIDGQKFYNTGDHYIGHLGADMKVYDAHEKCIGWVDAKGHAYTLDGAVFAEGKTPIWAATVLVYNLSSPA